MTLEQMNAENKLVAEKHEVVQKLINYLHHAQFDRTTPTSKMLVELREEIDVLLLNDF